MLFYDKSPDERAKLDKRSAEIWNAALKGKIIPTYQEPDDISFSEQNDIDLIEDFKHYNS